MNFIKRKVFSVFGKALVKDAIVLDVRAWEPAIFFEVDVHFPQVDMSAWTRSPYMKIHVGDGYYRDYSPAKWDTVKRTCTLYIDAVQDGPGSRWVKGLQAGTEINYRGPKSTSHQPPEEGGKIVVLGDSSAVGHFLALKQLAGNRSFTGAIAVASEQHIATFRNTLPWEVKPVMQDDEGGFSALLKWSETQDLTETEVFIVGHIPTCVRLRKALRLRKDGPRAIRVQGFWK